MSRRPARCTQAEIRRAIEAVKQSGSSMTVDILPDGTIRISPLMETQRDRKHENTGREIVL